MMSMDNDYLKSVDVLEAVRCAHKSREVVNVEEERVKVVVFTLGEKHYAFYGENITEILSSCEIYKVPTLPEYLPGLINVRGDIESAIDLGYFLGARRVSDEKALIVMAENSEFRSGIIIDAVDDVADILVSSIQPPLATLDGLARELAAGEIRIANISATLLDIDKIALKVTL